MDLTTTWLGLDLPHPFIAGASPLSETLDSARAAEDAGAAAIVMRSLFEEQIDVEALADHAAHESCSESFAEALTYLPRTHESLLGPEEALELLRRLKEALDIPVVGSLNGHTSGGWLEHARCIEQAGADAIELNVFTVVTDEARSAADVEDELVEMVRTVAGAVRVPVAVKLSPFYTALPHLARRLVDGGASGLVLFNRFFEPDIDVEELEVRSELHLSSSAELLLRLRWLAILSGTLETSLAVTGGVHGVLDAIKAIMTGAHAVQMVSALLTHGPEQLASVRDGVAAWLEEHEYDSLAAMRGSMDSAHCPEPGAYERGNYVQLLQTWRPA